MKNNYGSIRSQNCSNLLLEGVFKQVLINPIQITESLPQEPIETQKCALLTTTLQDHRHDFLLNDKLSENSKQIKKAFQYLLSRG